MGEESKRDVSKNDNEIKLKFYLFEELRSFETQSKKQLENVKER